MKLHNSLSNQLEDFQAIEAGKVRLYSCGPTVYNNLHIGNLSAFIYADVLRRTLQQANGYDVQHVMNVTDVDDKTIRDSKRDYPNDDPMTALKKLTNKYTDIFMRDLEATGNDVATMQFVSAVDTIDDMIILIQRIIDNGFAYAADDGIYFSIDAYTKAGHPYGLLQKIDVAHAQNRVANDEYDKDSASDFALWKTSEQGEPSWPATFAIEGKELSMPGRPGWHIECSAMSEKLLGVPFDIHTGGIDLKFPHHENEIAQTCAAGADKLANFFVHNNHMLVDGRKMSKSLGNFYTLRDIEEKGYEPEAFRLLILQSHYRTESNFSWEILDAAQNRLEELRAWADLRYQPSAEEMPNELDELFRDTRAGIKEALEDDLNTPQALSVLNKLVSYMATIPIPGVEGKYTDGTLAYIDSVFGLSLANRKDITDKQKDLLKTRAEARDSKDWAESDRIRDLLKEQGIGINDSPNGQIWYRI